MFSWVHTLQHFYVNGIVAASDSTNASFIEILEIPFFFKSKTGKVLENYKITKRHESLYTKIQIFLHVWLVINISQRKDRNSTKT